MSILVSGGAGYIGSHTCVELLNAGYDIVVADNYYNSCPEALKRVREITGKDFKFVEADMTDHAAVEKVFAENPGIDCVIQFAAYKAVGESVSKPIEYYSNNLSTTLTILAAMRRHGVNNIVFSSSATVYGDPETVPIRARESPAPLAAEWDRPSTSARQANPHPATRREVAADSQPNRAICRPLMTRGDRVAPSETNETQTEMAMVTTFLSTVFEM